MAGDCRYDAAKADHVVDFCSEMLVHVKGPLTGKPLRLEPWQADITRTMFGWRRPDGARRFTRAYIELPRKNGKTTWLAALLLYCLYCEEQSKQGAELYSAAATGEQAGLIYSIVASMIARNPDLKARAKVLRSTRRMNLVENGVIQDTFYRAIPANEGPSHGFNPTFLANDELHAWRGRGFYDALQTGCGARAEPLSIDITTAGYDRESICWMQHEYALRVSRGEVDDDAFLPVVYYAADEDDWTDPAVWHKANPNLGVSVQLSYLERECARAQESKTYENTFRRLHLNQWTSQEVRFLQMHSWRNCASDYTEADLAGLECYGGLDLSQTTDLTAFVLVFLRDGHYIIWPRFWISANDAARIERTDRVPYRIWAQSGIVTITPGEGIDYDYVHAQILEDMDRFDLRQVGYDPWSAAQTEQYLTKQGVTCVKMRQGVQTLSAPLKELERSILANEFEHPNNPCLNGQADNLEVAADANGNIRPVKPKHHSHGKKIDGMVALTMGIGLAMLRPEPIELSPECFLTLDL